MTFLWLLPVSLLLIGLYRWLTSGGDKWNMSMPDEEYRAKIAMGEGVSNSQKEEV